jgi:hypothetical protein
MSTSAGQCCYKIHQIVGNVMTLENCQVFQKDWLIHTQYSHSLTLRKYLPAGTNLKKSLKHILLQAGKNAQT